MEYGHCLFPRRIELESLFRRQSRQKNLSLLLPPLLCSISRGIFDLPSPPNVFSSKSMRFRSTPLAACRPLFPASFPLSFFPPPLNALLNKWGSEIPLSFFLSGHKKTWSFLRSTAARANSPPSVSSEAKGFLRNNPSSPLSPYPGPLFHLKLSGRIFSLLKLGIEG